MKPEQFKDPSQYTDKSEVKSPTPKPTKERIAEIAKQAEKELNKPDDLTGDRPCQKKNDSTS